jgi:hypothetical protein
MPNASIMPQLMVGQAGATQALAIHLDHRTYMDSSCIARKILILLKRCFRL